MSGHTPPDDRAVSDDRATSENRNDRRSGPSTRSRRRVLTTAATLGAAGLAGCAGTTDGFGDATGTPRTATDEEGGAGPTLQRVADPPEAVYVPTHFEGTRRLDPVRAGPYEVVPMVTYPHRFWTVTGETVAETTPSSADVHLMVAVRDPETGVGLPVETGLELTVAREGESGSTHAPWPMVSQEMGFHFGDNVPLGPDGTYEVSVRVGAVDATLTGEFAGRFDEPGRGSFTFEFDDEYRSAVVGDIAYLPETDRGRRGALAPMASDVDRGDGADAAEHEDGTHPHLSVDAWDGGVGEAWYGTFRRPTAATALPPVEALPGTVQGAPTSGDAVFATTLLGADSRFGDEADGPYLAVSPRTPYNRSTLPMTGLAYELARDGAVVASGDLRSTLDPELGYHYAASPPSVADGDELTVTVDTIPQVARHAGYQTAFRGMEPVNLQLRAP